MGDWRKRSGHRYGSPPQVVSRTKTTCLCGCGTKFFPKHRNQVYVNARHRERDKNRRWPVTRRSGLPIANGFSSAEKRCTAGVTPLGQGIAVQTKYQRRNEAMRRQESTEYLSPLQVARLLGMGAWNLLLWRKKGFGPPFIRVTRRIIRYPREGFEAWLASLPRT